MQGVLVKRYLYVVYIFLGNIHLLIAQQAHPVLQPIPFFRLAPTDTLILALPTPEDTFPNNYLGPIISLDEDISKHAQQKVVFNQQLLARYFIHVPNAAGLNFYFGDIDWENIEQLAIFNPQNNIVLGTFNQDYPIKNTTLLPGDFVVIEVVFKAAHSSPVPLAAVGVALKQSGACMVDVNCSEGNNWQKQKRGVVRLLITSGNSLFACTGSLLNTTQQDKTPYLLTAHHCVDQIADQEYDLIAVDFNYEKINCSSSLSSNPQSLVGTQLLSYSTTAGGSDYALLLLKDNVPAQYNPYFNGWSTLTTSNHNGVSLHHPLGDVKKISTFNRTLSEMSINQGVTNGYWRVEWQRTTNGHGVTEQGSSGSPLFNSAGLIVGVLSGGNASCGNLNGFDAYGRFDYHWDKMGSTPETRLMDWLDPTYTGLRFLSGMDDDNFVAPDTVNVGGDFEVNILNYPIGKNHFDYEIINNAKSSYTVQLIEAGSGKIVFRDAMEVELYGMHSVTPPAQLSQGVYLFYLYSKGVNYRKKIVYQP